MYVYVNFTDLSLNTKLCKFSLSQKTGSYSEKRRRGGVGGVGVHNNPCSTILALYPVGIWQKQQAQMQEVVKQLSQQQNTQKKENQLGPGQRLSNELLTQNILVQKHNQLVAEKESKIKELEEEIQKLSVQVRKRVDDTQTNLSKHTNIKFYFTFWKWRINTLFVPGSKIWVSKYAKPQVVCLQLLQGRSVERPSSVNTVSSSGFSPEEGDTNMRMSSSAYVFQQKQG